MIDVFVVFLGIDNFKANIMTVFISKVSFNALIAYKTKKINYYGTKNVNTSAEN